MRVVLAVITTLFISSQAFAQQAAKKQDPSVELRKGNALYKEKKYKEAQSAYQSALQKDPSSYTGMFNIGDALYQNKQYENARQALTASVKGSKDKQEQARAYHNIGNTFLAEKKWEEAANAYKQALRLDGTDADTKYNLAYANAMIKKDGGGGGKNNKDKKDDKDNKDNKDKKDQDKKDKDDKGKDDKDKKDQDKDKQDKDGQGDKDQDKKDQQKPQSQPSKLSQQQADNLLNALRQEEKKIQEKKDKDKGVPVKLGKDW
jgi:Ca-activated chloride channel family protein